MENNPNKTNISEIEIVLIKPKDGLVGFASFILDKKYYVGSVAIYTRLNKPGYRLVYPTKKINEENIDLFHPIKKEVGETIEEAVIKKVNKLFNEDFNERQRRKS